MVKKLSYVLMAIAMLIPCLFVPSDVVYAKTVGDLKRELDKYVADYESNKNKQKLTKQEIEQTKGNILSASREVEQIGNDIIKLNEEIEKLSDLIDEKNEEIKEIMNFVQVSNGESAYLEYTFGAKDFTDFIYRAAISEQLTNYNDQLVKDYNQAIIDNNNKTKELANRKESLKQKQENLAVSLEKLNNNVEELEESSISIEAEIKSRREGIALYQNVLGCKDNDDIQTCGTKTLPSDTAFWRPLISGTVTANYGIYSPFGYEMFHYGLDMSTVDNNTPVYSAANGVVAAVVRNQSCGKNIVYIRHIINGERYTTSYWHLRSITVSVGQVVTKDTQVGVMGGAARDGDSCSTGAHVHFVVARGLYLVDYQEHSTFNANRINPRMVLNAPKVGGYFANRYTKY